MRKINTVRYHLFVESKKSNKLMKRSRFTDTENKLVVIMGEREAAEGQHTGWGARGINH